MASGDSNELEEEVNRTGNDDSDRNAEDESGVGRRDNGQEEVSKKNEVSLADIIENPDKFPNMINIMIAMNKFPIDGGSVAKFLGEKFKQPVTPDKADKLLATVLLEMFRKISDDMNGIVLFDNGEIDDERSIQQAMMHGIPVPHGVNTETFEDKYRTAMSNIKKDAEIFSVERFVENFIEGNKDKYSKYIDIDKEMHPKVFFDMGYLGSLENYYSDTIKNKDIASLIKAFSKEGRQSFAKLVTGEKLSSEEEKNAGNTAEEVFYTAMLKYSEFEKTGELPGKTESEKLSNAILILASFNASNAQEDFVKEACQNMAKKISELTKGAIEPEGSIKNLLQDVIYYKDHDKKTLRYRSVKKHKLLSKEDIQAGIDEAISEVAKDDKISASARLYLQLEVIKQYSIDPTVIIEKQNALLERYPQIKEMLAGLYEEGPGSELSGMGNMIVYRVRTNILRIGMDRDIEAIKKRIETEPDSITPEQREYYAKVILARLSVAREDRRYNLLSSIKQGDKLSSGKARDEASRLLAQLYPEYRRPDDPGKASLSRVAADILKDPSIKMVDENVEKKIEVMVSNHFLAVYRTNVLFKNIDTVLQEKVSDERMDEFMQKMREELAAGDGHDTFGFDSLDSLTKTSRVDFSGQATVFLEVFKNQNINSRVTKENVVKLRYLELKLKEAQLRKVGAKPDKIKEVADQIKMMEQTDGTQLDEAFGDIDYKNTSFDEFLYSIDGNLDGKLSNILKDGMTDTQKESAELFSEVTSFNKRKVEARTCQYFFSNVFTHNADQHFSLTLDDELKDHLKYCINALEMAKNYESEANVTESESEKQELMAKKELFEKMAYRGLEVVSRGRKKKYIEFDENGTPKVNEKVIAERYASIDKRYRGKKPEEVLDGIYKENMTIYPAGKLDEYYAKQDELISFYGEDGKMISDDEKLKRIKDKFQKPTGKPNPKRIRDVSSLNVKKVMTCLKDRGLASTIALCTKRTISSFNLANKNAFWRQVIDGVLDPVYDGTRRQERLAEKNGPTEEKNDNQSAGGKEQMENETREAAASDPFHVLSETPTIETIENGDPSVQSYGKDDREGETR